MRTENKYGKFEAIKTIKESWNIYSSNFGGALLVSLIPIAITIFFQILSFFSSNPIGIFDATQNSEKLIDILIKEISIGMVLYFFQFIITLFTTAGIINFFISLVRNKKLPTPATLLIFDSRILHLFLFELFYYIISLPLIFITIIIFALPIFYIFASTSIAVKIAIAFMGIIVLAILLLFLNIMFSISKYLIIDKNSNAVDAMLESCKAMWKNSLEMLFILFILAFISVGVALTTLGLGLLLFFPFSYIVLAQVYVSVTTQKTPIPQDNLKNSLE